MYSKELYIYITAKDLDDDVSMKLSTAYAQEPDRQRYQTATKERSSALRKYFVHTIPNLGK